MHFALSNTGRTHHFIMDFLLTGYCSFCKFLSSDLPNRDFYSFDNFLSFQKNHLFANFPRFRSLKISYFQTEISITMPVSFNQFPSDLYRPKKRCVVSSAFSIQPNCLIYLKLLLTKLKIYFSSRLVYNFQSYSAQYYYLRPLRRPYACFRYI